MTTLRKFVATDLFNFNLINLDRFTETYNLGFYGYYFTRWPWLQRVVVAPDGTLAAYILGKVEGSGRMLHGHISAVTVAPEYRRLGVARALLQFLEQVSEQHAGAFFIDLFVRVSNRTAVDMYQRLGYAIYRTVVGYYADSEDAYDMRKPCPSRDPTGSCLVCARNRRRVRPHELEFD
ncbi:similar to N-terminal acetyltransferase complex ARD1 subunit [Cyanidioschyzon merolae strain 10D]|jgi:N-terminal acetyltransferase B complex catalytic subunit|uniref:Similar to N-terminal acetyltransferase complex ARD1 subunit n=1 Tax=Cyanidioschyzon merolae (strain NIES-3377 / 10D) TaxID=280699 RepID=M1USZ0_CYAM1|nr:similar to N-terminal acetyltransferase complex ARD1 subunit [Cyanidioschyzon merolae strain 10D]BAM80811.1 similar to N-terminal acetyltransferase complex ARD1 subunit [Cyanidioschyzon merolae strain 10D]|eukprot:XP_005536847.1 similar to N-terminal acetyltransferase complex ARD1 subunit [Cyanidioschyzon merolae strain 10D]